jgi:hypothetical protein
MADRNTQRTKGDPVSSFLDLLLGSGTPGKEGEGKKGTSAEQRATGSHGGLLDLLLGGNAEQKKEAGNEALKEKEQEEQSDEDLMEIEKRYHEGLQKVLDIIAPTGLEIGHKHITLEGGTLCRSFYVYNWPSQIHNNWLAPVVNYEATMDIAQFIYPTSPQAILRMLKRKVAEMRSTISMRQEKGLSRDPMLEAALEDAELLRDMLARGYEKLFNFGLYLTIYAQSEEKMKKIQSDIESLLGGKLVLTKPADFQMEHGWTSTIPLCVDQLEIHRNMNTSPLATSFPFSSSDLTSDKGVLYGINRHNESLVIFDRFQLPNANCTVFATSGAGKSYAVKLEVIRYLMMDTAVYIIDPENEYTELARVVGGGVIPLSIQSSHRINPFDLPKSVREEGREVETGELLREAVINLHGLFKLMLKEITPQQESILDKAILDTYALKGITLDTPNAAALEPPVLSDLVDVLMTTEGGEDMAKVLQQYTIGSFAGIFNKPTNIDIHSQLMVFQTRDLEDELRPMAIYIVLKFLWNEVRSSLQRRLIIMDEAWNLMQHEDSARFLYGLIKRARKYYLGITTITQDVEDFMNSPYGKPIVTNSAMQLLLKQAPSAIRFLQDAFNLTEGEKFILLNAGVGQGVFFAGQKHAAIQVVASPKEHEIVTTNPEEIAHRKEERQQLKKGGHTKQGANTEPLPVLPPERETTEGETAELASLPSSSLPETNSPITPEGPPPLS